MGGKKKTSCIGLLTSGGDCPGLNAAIRAVAKTAMHEYGIRVIGILDGFRGLVENRFVRLDNERVSGILTLGGTILGTSRDKPHKIPMGGQVMDMVQVAAENARNMQIDCLVCLGGGGTQKNALRLHAETGLNVMTLPKTIDNDIAETDVSFGFDTARGIATDAIDRLHTTATSHHRIIVCEIMGHRAGWLTVASGLAGGADVILIPEIPYDLKIVSEYLHERRRNGKRFSIVAVAEGASSISDMNASQANGKAKKKTKKHKCNGASGCSGNGGDEDSTCAENPTTCRQVQEPVASRVARRLQELTGTDARVTALGHVQRGGIPSAFDRMLCTLLGTKAVELLVKGDYNVMVAYREGRCVPVPLKQVAGRRKVVDPAGPLVQSARLVGTCLGDQ